ncbi:lysophospholipase [Ectothiorhodospiraceae bacterium 2226]|nr:lysophospholipase [Ectothiorhodospiraceae bacterium 2226]
MSKINIPSPTQADLTHDARTARGTRRRWVGLRRWRVLLLAAVLAAAALPLLLQGCGTSAKLPPQGKGEPVLHRDYAIMPDSYELPLATWRPQGAPTAVVLALHGFNDYHNAFRNVGPHLAQYGAITYAYDQRGFGATATRGEWAGTEALVYDAQQMIGLLQVEYPDLPLFVMGESMGGAVLITTLSRADAPDVDGAILIAPAVWARTTMNPFQRAALWVVSRLLPEREVTGRGLSITPSDNIAMLREQGRDPLVIKQTRIDALNGIVTLMDEALASARKLKAPALILYGARDEIIPKRPTCHMIATLPRDPGPRWRLAYYPDGYHMLTRDLQGPVVLEDIGAWIGDPGSPLPSGQEAADGGSPTFC